MRLHEVKILAGMAVHTTFLIYWKTSFFGVACQAVNRHSVVTHLVLRQAEICLNVVKVGIRRAGQIKVSSLVILVTGCTPVGLGQVRVSTITG